MLKEFFESLIAQASKSAEPKKVQFDFGPRNAAFVINGETQVFNSPNPPVDYTGETLEDFVDLCKKFGCDLVLIGEQSVKAYVDSKHKIDQLKWSRTYTPAFQRLLEWAKGENVEQRRLVALMRNELREAGGATAMLSAARNLRFEKSESQSANLHRGDESIGLEAMSKLVGADQLPEFLLVDTAVYIDEDSRDLAQQFHLLVDPLPVQKLIRLQAIEDQLLNALLFSQKRTQDELRKLIPNTTIILGC